jgi:hypothetical protein
MNSKEYVIWLKGFVAASNNFNLTPSAWQELKDKLLEVDDDTSITSYKNYVNPHGYWKTTSTYEPPYTTGGEDEIVKHHNED